MGAATPLSGWRCATSGGLIELKYGAWKTRSLPCRPVRHGCPSPSMWSSAVNRQTPECPRTNSGPGSARKIALAGANPGKGRPAPGPRESPRHRNAPHPHRAGDRAAQRMARHPTGEGNRGPDRGRPRRRRRGTRRGHGDVRRRRGPAIIAAARAAAYRRDPRTVTQRASHAATERHVSLRPAPDTMCYFTALLPARPASRYTRPDPARGHPAPPGTPAPAANSWQTPLSNAPPAPPAGSPASKSSSS